MQKKWPWIIGGTIVAGGLVWVVFHKKVPPKKPMRTVPPAGTGGTAGTMTPVAGGPATGAATPNGIPGSNVFSKAGLIIHSSPKLSTGFWSDLFNNELATIPDDGVFVGNIVSATVDSNGSQDSAGNIYTWYLINPAPAYGSPGGGSYYVREDYITVK